MIAAFKQLIERRNRRATIKEIASTMAHPHGIVAQLFDEMGEFGTVMTLYISTATGRDIAESKRLTIEGAKAMGAAAAEFGLTAEQACQAFGKFGGRK